MDTEEIMRRVPGITRKEVIKLLFFNNKKFNSFYQN
jgi:hypothetical protein